MKSSFEQFIRFTIASKRGTLRSTQLSRGQPLLGGGLLDLLAVLVGAGEEIDVVAVEPHEARDGIGGDRFIGMADMRRAIRIGDRGRDVKRCLGRHFELFVQTGWPGKSGHGERGTRYQPQPIRASEGGLLLLPGTIADDPQPFYKFVWSILIPAPMLRILMGALGVSIVLLCCQTHLRFLCDAAVSKTPASRPARKISTVLSSRYV